MNERYQICRTEVISFKSYCRNTHIHTHTHTHTGPIATPRPLTWSVTNNSNEFYPLPDTITIWYLVHYVGQVRTSKYSWSQMFPFKAIDSLWIARQTCTQHLYNLKRHILDTSLAVLLLTAAWRQRETNPAFDAVDQLVHVLPASNLQ